MSKQNVLIFKIPELFKILNELKNYLDFAIYEFSEKEDLFSFKKKNSNYLILTEINNKIEGEKIQLILEVHDGGRKSNSLLVNTPRTPPASRAPRLVGLHEQRDAGERPLLLVLDRAQRAREDEGGAADGGHEEGARVHALGDDGVDGVPEDLHHRHLRVQLHPRRVADRVVRHVPVGALHEEAVDVGALVGLGVDAVGHRRRRRQ